jgi:hypothetical protein
MRKKLCRKTSGEIRYWGKIDVDVMIILKFSLNKYNAKVVD